MAQGLQAWDASGKLTLDTNDPLAKILGTFYTGSSSGSISAPGLSRGRPFYFATAAPSEGGDASGFFVPKVTLNGPGEVISWQFTAGLQQSPAYITYGVW